MNSTYEMGDIVRFKDSPSLGLWEITGTYDKPAYQYSITKDACDSESFAKHNQLVLVCSVKDRKDID